MKYKIITVITLAVAGLIYFVFQHYRSSDSIYSPEINAVLSMAGNNRVELEKVLKHYSRNPSDSLKLRAAVCISLRQRSEIPAGFVMSGMSHPKNAIAMSPK
jgi:hypothetical protein